MDKGETPFTCKLPKLGEERESQVKAQTGFWNHTNSTLLPQASCLLVGFELLPSAVSPSHFSLTGSSSDREMRTLGQDLSTAMLKDLKEQSYKSQNKVPLVHHDGHAAIWKVSCLPSMRCFVMV